MTADMLSTVIVVSREERDVKRPKTLGKSAIVVKVIQFIKIIKISVTHPIIYITIVI